MYKGFDCFGAARLAMTSRRRHCEPKAGSPENAKHFLGCRAKQSRGGSQLIGFLKSFR
jgi:hypothetical protein